MRTEFYTQCRLVAGTVHTTAFIPSKYAEIGKNITIKGEHWTVSQVFEQVEYKDIKDQQHECSNIWSATSGPIVIGHK